MTQRTKHNQEVFFDNGTRRTFENVVSMIRGTWWHLFLEDNTEIIINPDRVLLVQMNPDVLKKGKPKQR